jgi:LacI family transcriptional regulator
MARNQRRITATELARDLGVSRATIDRALNGRGRINEETRSRIVARAGELGYKPNLTARALALTRPFRITAIIPELPVAFFSQMYRGVREAADGFADHPFEVNVLRTEHHDLETQLRLLGELDGSACDGLILVPSDERALDGEIDRLVDAGVRVVCINSDAPGSRRHTFIGQDFYVGGRVAAEVLGKLIGGGGPVRTPGGAPPPPGTARVGASVFAVGGYPEIFAHRRRLEGFLDEFREFFPDIRAITGPPCYDEPELAYRAVAEILETDETVRGVFTSTGAGTLGILRALREMRQRHPGRTVRFVGFDILPESEEGLRSGEIDAIVEQNPYRQGAEAVALMHRAFVLQDPDHPATIFTDLTVTMRNHLAG